MVKVKMDEKDHKTDNREDFKKKMNCGSTDGYIKRGSHTEGEEAAVLDEEMKGWSSERD